MDERTRKSDEALPGIRPAVPEPRTKTPSRWKFRLGLAAAILLVAGLTYQTVRWTMSSSTTGRSGQAPPQTVGAATAALGNINVIVNALGTVTPIATVTVQTQISGQLLEVGYAEGQMVKKGDFLAQVDPRPYQILKEQYQGQLARDQGLLAQAQMDLKRYQTLAQQNSIARQQSEDQVFIVQQYEGSVKQDQGMIDAEDLNIAYCRIVSPITGRVGLRLVDPGNYVQTSSATGLAVITQLQPISVIFSIPEDDLPQIMPQINAGTTLTVEAYDRANLRRLATGHVIAVDSQVDTTTGTVKIRAQFDNNDNALFPNQFVNARLLERTLHNVVTVPTAAIQRGAPGAYVYVINADNTVAVRQVTTGAVDGDLTMISAGLQAGERVVTDGTDRLRDGLRVIVVAPSGAATGSRGAQQGQGPGQTQHDGGRRNQDTSQNGGQNTPPPSAAPSSPASAPAAAPSSATPSSAPPSPASPAPPAQQ